jgi:hypothetical protein
MNLGSKVPFSLIGFVAGSVGGVAMAGERPNAVFSAFGETVDLGWLANLDPAITVLRTLLAFLMWIGVAWFLYGRTIGRDT